MGFHIGGLLTSRHMNGSDLVGSWKRANRSSQPVNTPLGKQCILSLGKVLGVLGHGLQPSVNQG